MKIDIRPAIASDVPVILGFIRELADYEKLLDHARATEAMLREHLFGPRPAAEVLMGELGGVTVGFALYFGTFSTFVGKPGIWLEDLYVQPHARAQGVGKALLKAVARIAGERGCGRLEWSVLDWNEPSIGFYKKLGAVPMDEWTTFRVTGRALDELASE